MWSESLVSLPDPPWLEVVVAESSLTSTSPAASGSLGTAFEAAFVGAKEVSFFEGMMTWCLASETWCFDFASGSAGCFSFSTSARAGGAIEEDPWSSTAASALGGVVIDAL